MTLGALLLISVVLPWVVGAAAGTLEIPRNDDWSYRGIATRLYSTGRLELDGAAEAAVLGQILFVQPLLWLTGGTPPAFLAAGILFSLGATAAGYLLARRLLDRRSATLAVGTLVFFPAYLAYSISYMTDVPALACQFACLGLASVAIGRHPISGRWLVGAFAIGMVGFSIREFALAAPAAVLAVVMIREPVRPKTWITLVLFALVSMAILATRLLLPGQLGDVPWEIQPVQALLPPVVTVSLVLAPVALVAAVRWRGVWNLRDVVIGLVVGGIVSVAVLRIGIFPHVLLYDLITQWGSPSAQNLIGGRPKLFSDTTWSAIGILALAAAVLVAGITAGVMGAHVRRAARQPDRIRARLGSPLGLLVFFVLAITFGLGAFGLVGWLYDRYLWPIIVPLAVLLLYVPGDSVDRRRATRREQPAAGSWRAAADVEAVGLGSAAILFIAVVVAMSGAFFLNSNAYDGARWRAAQDLVALGFTAESTDAGPEWVNSHQTGFATVTQPGAGLTWWQKHWPSFRLCAFIAASPQSTTGVTVIKLEPSAYRLYLFLGPDEPFYFHRVSAAGCP